jgi:ABC-2 type transport system ATP-binding protein
MESQPETAISVRNLTKFYKDLKAVDGLSLDIRTGEVFGFLGPNGAGKSTSINMICGLLKPSDGEVFINGEKTIGQASRELRARVGVCPQNIIIWPKLTCYEQLVFIARMYGVSSKLSKSRADELLDQLGLKEKRNKLANTLSGGMQRRLNVLMALMHDPEIVIFDEPEAGLDPQSRLLVREFIIETARNKTVIFTTHNMDEADRVSDRVAIIDKGKLLKLDTPSNLKTSIGEGDILELSIAYKNEESITSAMEKLEKMELKIIRTDQKLMLVSRNMITKIHDIYRILESGNIQITELKMRENSLEDVFIHLTGRRLRQ